VRDLADRAHLVHVFRRELKPEALFEREDEIEMLNGIPSLDRFR